MPRVCQERRKGVKIQQMLRAPTFSRSPAATFSWKLFLNIFSGPCTLELNLEMTFSLYLPILLYYTSYWHVILPNILRYEFRRVRQMHMHNWPISKKYILWNFASLPCLYHNNSRKCTLTRFLARWTRTFTRPGPHQKTIVRNCERIIYFQGKVMSLKI